MYVWNLFVGLRYLRAEITAHLNIVRAYAGVTVASSPETIFDTDEFNEQDYLAQTEVQSGNLPLTMNW